jgi:para-nitrobenzyl esterase
MRNLRLAEQIAVTLLALSLAGCEGKKVSLVAEPTSLRTTSQGAVVGAIGEYGSHVWLGLPYAKPPLGELRWRAPQPADPWSGTRQALEFSSPCVQFASVLGGVTSAAPGTPVGSEDCLYANVYAPRFTPDRIPVGAAGLPVMLWIHGGGNTIGQGGFYDGGNLAVTENVVVVTFNYRLGPFGWFRHAALRAGTADRLDQSGNYGTLDLVRALEWVRDNIAAFGGDPGNVTIFGESAGGQNVYSLMLSRPAQGIFHRAIVQSGGLWFAEADAGEKLKTDDDPQEANSSSEVIARLLIADGRAGDRQAAIAHLQSMPEPAVERYLRAKPAAEILSAYDKDPQFGMIDMPKVFRDGVVLPEVPPMQALANPDQHNDVPIMLGTTKDENKLFMFGNPRWVSRTLWVFLRMRDERMYNITAEYLAKNWKATGVDEPAVTLLSSQKSKVYAYRFDWDEEPTILGADLSVMLGASHGFEIPFVFGHFNLGPEGNRLFTSENEPGRKELAAKMMSYWAAFAYDGAPGRGRRNDLTEWKPWDNSSPGALKFMVLDTQGGGGTRMSGDAITTEEVLANVATDPRLPSKKDKCSVWRDLANWARGVTKAEYAARCSEYPIDEYPWG